ncbi:MAG: ERCC4 domain-containing protein [Candidatus Micrarchaeia archaeon]
MLLQPKIIADNRERNMQIIDRLSELGTQLTFAQLPVGDYVLSDRICIERKSVNDLENSIMNSRLFEQLDRLKKSFQKPMLLVEGDSSEFRLSSSVILGTAVAVYTDYDIPILWSEGGEESADILYYIARREQQQKEREPRAVGVKKAYTLRQWQLLILESVPGVGPKLAARLLSEFKSIRNVVNANIEMLQKTDKIGKKKAETIYKVLNEDYDGEDKII